MSFLLKLKQKEKYYKKSMKALVISYQVINTWQSISLVNGIGKIRFLNLKNSTFPVGLLIELVKFCKKNNWEISVDKRLKLDSFDFPLSSFVNNVIPELKLDPYDFQLETFIKSIQLNRSLVLSPTRKSVNRLLSILL